VLTLRSRIGGDTARSFDLSRRYESLDARPDPLVALNRLIRWEDFRPALGCALEAVGQRDEA
jgi:hypothetical protein